MSNLFKRLKEDIKEQLEKSAERHPAMIQSIYEDLEQTSRYSQLTIDQVMNIYTFSDVSLLKTSVWDLKYGDNLFKEF